MCHMAVHKRFSNLKTWYAWREATLSGWQPPKNRDYRVFAQVWDTFKQEPIGEVDKSHWAFKLLDVEPDLYNRDVEIEDINAAQKLF